MAYAQHADRGIPRGANKYFAAIAAAAGALIIAGVLSFTALPSLDLGPTAAEAPNPALLDAGGRWELQRKLQSGDLDPLAKAEREWERQRMQQSPFD